MGTLVKVKFYDDGYLDYYNKAGGFRFPLLSGTLIMTKQTDVEIDKKGIILNVL